MNTCNYIQYMFLNNKSYGGPLQALCININTYNYN